MNQQQSSKDNQSVSNEDSSGMGSQQNDKGLDQNYQNQPGQQNVGHDADNGESKSGEDEQANNGKK